MISVIYKFTENEMFYEIRMFGIDCLGRKGFNVCKAVADKCVNDMFVDLKETSTAASALDSWRTPTVALTIKISTMTSGSMNAVVTSSSSKNANTKDINAAKIKMMTNTSVNCFKINNHKGVPIKNRNEPC